MIEFVSLYVNPAALSDFSVFARAFDRVLTPVHFVLRAQSTLAEPLPANAIEPLLRFAERADRLPDHFGVHLELAGDLVPAFLTGNLPSELYEVSLDCLRLRLDCQGHQLSAQAVADAAARDPDHHLVLRNAPVELYRELVKQGVAFSPIGSTFLRDAAFFRTPQGISFAGVDDALARASEIAGSSPPVRGDWIDIGDVASSERGWRVDVAVNAVKAVAAATYIGLDLQSFCAPGAQAHE